MNGAPHFTVANPLDETIREGEEIIDRIAQAAEQLNQAIRYEAEASSAARDAGDLYDVAETEALAEVFTRAKMKDSPLAGLAVTSKAYDIMLSNVRNELRKNDLADFWQRAEERRMDHERAKLALQQATTTFTAMRKVCDVKAAILRAAAV